MSFDKLKLADLREAALDFGIAVNEAEAKKMTRANIVEGLKDDGVTYDQYENHQQLKASIAEAEEGEEPEANVNPAITLPDDHGGQRSQATTSAKATKTKPANDMFAGNTLLIKMDRDNFSFEIPTRDKKNRWRWTKEHPYVVMPKSEASDLLDTYQGFRIANPSEADDYYG